MADRILEQFDLNLLTALDALLEECSVTKAAARLGITQSGMSHKLRRLRDALEDPLLVAGQHGFVPTARAVEVHSALRRGLRELQTVVTTPDSFDTATSTRTFNVMSPDFAAFAILPLVLQELSRDAPGVSVNIIAPSTDPFPELEQGRVDAMVGRPLPPRSGLMQKTIATDQFACLVRRGHPDVHGSLDIDTYCGVPHIVTKGPNLSPVDGALAELGRSRRVTMRIPNFTGAPFIVARTNLVLTTSLALALEACRILPLEQYPPPLSLRSFDVVMTWHERNNLDPGHRYLRGVSERATKAVVDEHRVVPFPGEVG